MPVVSIAVKEYGEEGRGHVAARISYLGIVAIEAVVVIAGRCSDQLNRFLVDSVVHP